jgi:hypothetical protein
MANGDAAITLMSPTLPMASAQKSALRRMYEASLGRALAAQAEVHPYTRALVQSIRSEGGALIVGGALGYIDAHMGLDQRMGEFDTPIDGVASLGLTLLSLAMAKDPDGLAIDVRNAASVATGIYAFRQVKRWQKNEGAGGPARIAGEPVDPIIACAASLA